MKKLAIAVEGMECPLCATAMENKLRRVAGVRNVRVDYRGGRATLEYDERVISPEDFAETGDF